MFSTLQRRITLAFLIIIFLAVGLVGAMAWNQTVTQFEIFVTEQGRMEAEFLASLLEAKYNLDGNLDDVGQTLGFNFFDEIPEGQVIADAGFVMVGAGVPTDAWDNIVAIEMGLPIEQIRLRPSDQSIAEIAMRINVEPSQLTNSILLEEVSVARTIESNFPDEPLFYLADRQAWANEYIFVSEDELMGSLTAGPVGFFTNERVFVFDAVGAMLFDSLGQEAEVSIDDEDRQQGVAITDWRSGKQVGTVLVAAGPDFYDERDQAFLNNLVRALLLGSLVAGGVALLVSSLLARQITTPIVAMTDAVTRLAQGQSGERLVPKGSSEVGKMSHAFNQLSDSLTAQRELRHQLVADMSHEFNTPLTVIRAEMEGLQYGMQGGDEAAKHVIREVERLQSLARDLTLLAEQDRGELPLSFEPLDMASFVSAETKRWQIEAETRGVVLQSAPMPKKTLTIQADVVRLSQALGNLIRNALQYTPAGGQITVSLQEEADWLKIKVRDTGIGIAPDHLPHIFDRFFRVDSARQRATGRRGLGLAIVNNLIELHAGHVFADSELGQGSAIGFALPISGNQHNSTTFSG